jgi:hypothetical protein
MTEKDIRREHLIRERAYYLWLAAGSPIGRDTEFWAQAETELFPQWLKSIKAEWGKKDIDMGATLWENRWKDE